MLKVKNVYFISSYHLKKIDYSELKKIIFYLLGFTFLLGAALEVFTRHEILIYIETYLFLLSTLLVIARIYKMADIRSRQIADVDKNSIDNITLGYRFYFKYMLATSVIGAVIAVVFISLLKEYKP